MEVHPDGARAELLRRVRFVLDSMGSGEQAAEAILQTLEASGIRVPREELTPRPRVFQLAPDVPFHLPVRGVRQAHLEQDGSVVKIVVELEDGRLARAVPERVSPVVRHGPPMHFQGPGGIVCGAKASSGTLLYTTSPDHVDC